MGAIFRHIFAYKMPKIQKNLNLYIRFVKGHTRKVHAKFQVPSMYGVQMNVPFVLFYKSHVQVFDRIVI